MTDERAFSRRDLLASAAVAGLALVIPAPVRALIRDAPAVVDELGDTPSLTMLVSRGRGHGKAAQIRYMAEELLDDEAAFPCVTSIFMDDFLHLQDREPGRASDPVYRGRQYALELVDGRGHRAPLTRSDWREWADHDRFAPQGQLFLRAELVDV